MSRTEETYRRHHEQKNRLGFSYGGNARISILADWIGYGQRVLDLGCRGGVLTSRLPPGNSVVGADIDGVSLRRGKEAGQLSEVVQLDAMFPLPFSAGSFTAVLCGEFIEHQPFPEWLLEETVRILEPGRRFVGSTPNSYRWKNRLRFLAGLPFDPDPTHLRFFSKSLLHQLLAKYFSEIEIRPIVGRFVALHPGGFANTLVWRCRKKER
jgi:SAM-dependent methyltransferase